MPPRTHDGVIAVQLRRDGQVVAETGVPFPRLGLAGGRLIVSPRERLVLLALFSGQSEEGYELFQLGDGIVRISGLPYQSGEAADYGFSADESTLVMALPFNCIEWWLPWEEGEANSDGAGRLVFAFGQLWIHEIATSNISVHELRVSVAENWQPTRRAYDPYLKPRFTNDGRHLALSMPWGDVEVPMTLDDAVTLVVES